MMNAKAGFGSGSAQHRAAPDRGWARPGGTARVYSGLGDIPSPPGMITGKNMG